MRFFDVGINEEGYWNYNQIALQVEDVFDELAIKYPQYDIVLLMDQSSGHGKMREGIIPIEESSESVSIELDDELE